LLNVNRVDAACFTVLLPFAWILQAMARVSPVLLEAPRIDAGEESRTLERPASPAPNLARADIRLSVHEDIAAIEREWRDLEQRADGTVFQTYAWLSTWQRHIGSRRDVRPAVVIARDARGEILLLLALAVERSGVARRLSWLGAELCDYNAPLLAKDFSQHVTIARFRLLWADVLERLRSHPRLAFDLIDLAQMPETVGGQHNPMLHLGAAPHRNCAYLVSLADSWDKQYAKRSSATRRHDRAKRTKLAEHGEVRCVNATEPAEIVRTLDTLMAQKARWFAEMGVENFFVRPGVREFFLAIASDPGTRAITHVSRLEVGGTAIATNLGLMFGGCYYHVLASYDRGSELARFGPGAAHLHELMRHAIGQGFRKFDFSVGDERYKHEWCDSELKLYDHLAVASVRGACAALPILLSRRVKTWIKRNPAIWNAFRRARAAVGSLRISR
jgi:CelD/BcsL family acetyltransferase involved in cellulose biosynthesis